MVTSPVQFTRKTSPGATDSGQYADAKDFASMVTTASDSRPPVPPVLLPSYFPSGLHGNDVLLVESPYSTPPWRGINSSAQSSFEAMVASQFHVYLRNNRQARALASHVVEECAKGTVYIWKTRYYRRWNAMTSREAVVQHILEQWAHMTDRLFSEFLGTGRKRPRREDRQREQLSSSSSAVGSDNIVFDYWRNYTAFWNWAQHAVPRLAACDLPGDLSEEEDAVLGTAGVRARHGGTLRFGDLLQHHAETMIREGQTERMIPHVVDGIVRDWRGRIFYHASVDRGPWRALSAETANLHVGHIFQRMYRLQKRKQESSSPQQQQPSSPTTPRRQPPQPQQPIPTPTDPCTRMVTADQYSSSYSSSAIQSFRTVSQAIARGVIYDNDVLFGLDTPLVQHHPGTLHYRRILKHVSWDFRHTHGGGLYIARKVKDRVRRELGGCFLMLFSKVGWDRMDDPDALSLQVVRDLEEMETAEILEERSSQMNNQQIKKYFEYPKDCLPFNPTQYDVFVGMGRFYRKGEATPPGNARFLRMVRDRCPTYRRHTLTVDDLTGEIIVRLRASGCRFFCPDGPCWALVSNTTTAPVSHFSGTGAPTTGTDEEFNQLLLSNINETFEIMEQRMEIVKNSLAREVPDGSETETQGSQHGHENSNFVPAEKSHRRNKSGSSSTSQGDSVDQEAQRDDGAGSETEQAKTESDRLVEAYIAKHFVTAGTVMTPFPLPPPPPRGEGGGTNRKRKRKTDP